ncbi:hypothetical protein V496_02781 [Pseudogymnoascus sp. VKM F-4515 (FW-2607)]|nr:hypothetical protein V496_02781 [Pseudogymnoascus sp. VKM F-4515 (FW-2607)]
MPRVGLVWAAPPLVKNCDILDMSFAWDRSSCGYLSTIVGEAVEECLRKVRSIDLSTSALSVSSSDDQGDL